MSEFYESGEEKKDESSCSRCLRSSPLSSLLLMILVFLAGTAFGVGTIFGLKRFLELLEVDHLFPYMDYAVYATVGATGLFVVIVYIVCAVSSGWNAKRCFEGTRATSCGRCLNFTLLMCLVFGTMFWTLVSCLLTYPVMSASLVLYRDAAPALSLPASAPIFRSVRQAGDDPSKPAVLDVDPSDVIAKFFTCDPNKIDLSYYGLYGTNGKPIMLDSNDLKTRLRDPLIFISVALLGSIVILFCYVLLTCCAAANYARLKDLRYYEPSVNDDETIRLRH